jgi:hypothetical protein
VIIGDFGTSQQNGQAASRPQLQPLVTQPGEFLNGSGKIVVAKELFGQLPHKFWRQPHSLAGHYGAGIHQPSRMAKPLA